MRARQRPRSGRACRRARSAPARSPTRASARWCASSGRCRRGEQALQVAERRAAAAAAHRAGIAPGGDQALHRPGGRLRRWIPRRAAAGSRRRGSARGRGSRPPRASTCPLRRARVHERLQRRGGVVDVAAGEPRAPKPKPPSAFCWRSSQPAASRIAVNAAECPTARSARIAKAVRLTRCRTSRRTRARRAASATRSRPANGVAEAPQACSARIVRSRSPAPLQCRRFGCAARRAPCGRRGARSRVAPGGGEADRRPGRVELAAGLPAARRRSRRRRSARRPGRRARGASRRARAAAAGALRSAAACTSGAPGRAQRRRASESRAAQAGPASRGRGSQLTFMRARMRASSRASSGPKAKPERKLATMSVTSKGSAGRPRPRGTPRACGWRRASTCRGS